MQEEEELQGKKPVISGLKKLTIKITPSQYVDLMAYCKRFHQKKLSLDAEQHYTDLLVMSEIYETLDSKSSPWSYSPPGTYRNFQLSYIQFFVLADELMCDCPSFSLNDILIKLDQLFLNRYDYSLTKKRLINLITPV